MVRSSRSLWHFIGSPHFEYLLRSKAKQSKANQTNKVELRVESILNEPNTDINKLKRTVGLFNMLYASFRFIYSFAYSLCLEVSQSLSPNDYTKNVCMHVCVCVWWVCYVLLLCFNVVLAVNFIAKYYNTQKWFTLRWLSTCTNERYV